MVVDCWSGMVAKAADQPPRMDNGLHDLRTPCGWVLQALKPFPGLFEALETGFGDYIARRCLDIVRLLVRIRTRAVWGYRLRGCTSIQYRGEEADRAVKQGQGGVSLDRSIYIRSPFHLPLSLNSQRVNEYTLSSERCWAH